MALHVLGTVIYLVAGVAMSVLWITRFKSRRFHAAGVLSVCAALPFIALAAVIWLPPAFKFAVLLASLALTIIFMVVSAVFMALRWIA